MLYQSTLKWITCLGYRPKHVQYCQPNGKIVLKYWISDNMKEVDKFNIASDKKVPKAYEKFFG